MPERLFVSTTPGLEGALEGEARAQGWEASPEPGGVTLTGPEGLHQEANLRLRTASRVMLQLAAFPLGRAPGPELAKVPLSRYAPGGVRVRTVGQGPLAALEEAARRAWKVSSQADAPEVQLRAHGTECAVSIDSSGELLYLRGYRQEVSRAPLRETLAAGLLLIAGYEGGEPLWDPMCGSGTIAIEGALIASGRAPGAQRSFAFQRFPSNDQAAWEARLAQSHQQEHPPPHPIWATDLNSGSLGTARRNARRAGMQQWLTLERKDATQLQPPAGPPGLVAANLPYGIRVGQPGELPKLYQGFGAALRKFTGWRYSLLVADEAAPSALGLRPERMVGLSNGGIRCQLLLGRLG